MILTGLAIFAGLSLNLVLQFGLGAGQAGTAVKIPLYQIAVLFVTVILLWVIYTYVFSFLSWELMVFFLFFPFSVLVCLGLEKAEILLFPDKKKVRLFSAMTAYGGLIPASLIITVNMAVTFFDALILSFFFAIGSLLAIVIMKDIYRRSIMEKVPENLRGTPIAFISMGLLAMIFSAAAWICFRVIQ